MKNQICKNQIKQILIGQQLLKMYSLLNFIMLFFFNQEVDKSNEMLSEVSIQFDETDRLLIYPSAIGIKFVDINSSKVIFNI